MSASRCIKLLLLLSLIPLALRATSLLLGGHAVPVPATAASSRHSWAAWHRQSSRATASARVVSTEPVRVRPYRRATHRSAALAASDGGTRRLRQVPAGGDWFEDDKRLAPTGSNPLHNLR